MNLRHPNSGQGLLEMIVAIGIIVSGLSTTLSLVASSRSAEVESATRLAAANLAREAIEVARAIRDSNWLSGSEWNSGLIGPGYNRTAVPTLTLDGGQAAWSMDFTPADVNDQAARIYRERAGTALQYLHNHYVGVMPPASSEPTVFQRLVYLYPICRDDLGNETIPEGETVSCPAGSVEVGVDVRSTVVWSLRGRVHRVMPEEKLYDWR